MENNVKSKVEPYGRKDENVIEKLADVWPEPCEQLHVGGWNATYQLEIYRKLADKDPNKYNPAIMIV